MIWSVSTSARSSTLTGPAMTRTGSMSVASAGRPDPRTRRSSLASLVSACRFATYRRAVVPGPDVDEVARDRGRRGHLGRHEVRAPAAALAALEVAVRRRRAALAGREDVRVHPEAHRAAGGAPVEPGGGEDAVDSLRLGLRAHLLGAGHHHRPHVGAHLAALDHARGGAQVADPGVRAGADEHAVEPH